MNIKGIWLPIITPFKNGTPDLNAIDLLIQQGLRQGVSGFVLLGTTGETSTLSEEEADCVLSAARKSIGNRVPFLIGAGCNNTQKSAARLRELEKHNPDGFLVVSPYYNRPDQRGIIAHFSHLAEATEKPLVLYNIPYRTGRNMDNSTIRTLAQCPTIVGIKDACGDIHQTMDLLHNPPEDFSVLCGEDAFFYTMMLHGASGGILASSHIKTNEFVKMCDWISKNNWKSAYYTWNSLYPLIQLLFKEPNPAPIKHCLKELGYIESDEVRLPLVSISAELKLLLNQYLQTIIPYSTVQII